MIDFSTEFDPGPDDVLGGANGTEVTWDTAAFAVTMFFSHTADRKQEHMLSAADLAEWIKKTSQKEKGLLPWLKLARFGDIRTDKGSYRHDANVLAISGIEADYDREKMSFDEAREKMKAAGLSGIVYTSPSHTPTKPRLRVLCPLSQEYPPADRARFLGRLNGLFGGVFSDESWTLSQSYYFGSVKKNPAHQVDVIVGTPIDRFDALDATAMGKPDIKPGIGNGAGHTAGPVDVAALLRSIREGRDYHRAMVRIIGKLFRSGQSMPEVRTIIVEAMESVFPPDRDARWRRRMADLDRCLNDIYGKEAARRVEEEAAFFDPDDESGDTSTEPPGDRWGQESAPFALDPDRTAELLSAKALLLMDIPPPEPLLGSLVTKSTRAFLVGPTGLGKTMMGYSIAAGMAAGIGFLHWRSARPCRVLVIDGEMPGDLVQQRLLDALRRAGLTEPPERLFFFALDLYEQVARQYPQLGKVAPLCKREGQRFVMSLVEALKPDVVIFDNVMALLGTAALEPEKWEATLPLVAALTANRIGQLWLDHTNKAGLQYGTGTKSWRFDTVGVMLPLESEDRSGDDVAFTLSFDGPGKARRRTPDNRADYARVVIRLRDDRWTAELADNVMKADSIKPSVRVFYDALIDALAVASTRPGETTKGAWQGECLRKGLIEPPQPGETAPARDRRMLPLRRAQSALIAAEWIAVDGLRVIDRRHRY